MKKKEIIEFKEEVKKKVNICDPWYLIESGAPDDEYNKYIDQIVSFIINYKPNLEQLYLRLMQIFATKEFDLTKDSEKIRSLAKKLFEI